MGAKVKNGYLCNLSCFSRFANSAGIKDFRALVVGYAFSPIDLIPDFVPVLGLLDDLLLLPLGIWLVIKMIPPQILIESREKAQQKESENKPRSWIAAFFIISIWLSLVLTGIYLWRMLR